MTKAKEKIVNTPLEYGITTVEDFLNLKARDYQDTSFISNQVIKYDKGLKIAGNLNRLMQVKDYIARVEINIPKEDDITPEKSRFITVKPKLAATVKNPYLILDCSNNRTEGIASAKSRGVKFGRPKTELPKDFIQIFRIHNRAI